MTNDLSDRASTLLKVLVARHIVDGQPVGSRTLREESGLTLSPATIRNVMSDLEERGFLHSPHTSAGRVPTSLGYRFFVDTLMQVRPPEEVAVEALRSELHPDRSSSDLVQSASTLVSSITSQAGVVTVPKPAQQPLRQVEFLSLSGDRVLAILVVNQREVQNRIIHTRRIFSEEELREAAAQINERFAGRELADIQANLSAERDAARAQIDDYLEATVDLAQQALVDDGSADECLIVGESRLLEGADPEQIDRLRELFQAFERKRDIIHLLDRCAEADGVQIFIGEEAGVDMLGDYSLVTAPYGDGARTLGVLGVIGPRRMAYDRVISIVDVTSRMLSSALAN